MAWETSGMDIEANPNHLAAELAELRRVLATITPTSITKTARELHDIRTARAKVAERFQIACAHRHYSSPEKGPSAEMVALENELEDFDRQIGSLREKLTVARTDWKPRYVRAVRPHLDAANSAMAHAADLIEAAARLHHESDRFAVANGLSDGLPKSKRLEDLAATLRRFSNVREQK
jgi:hypothetical protein